MNYKKINLFFIFLVFLFISPKESYSQDAYTYSLGVRGGNMIGATYKRFVWPLNGVLEGIVGFNYYDRLYSLTGLYEYHKFISYRSNLYGGGGITFSANKNTFELRTEVVIGLEYVIEWFPVNISLDYKPGFSVFKKELYYDEFGLSIRYILKG